MIIASNSISEKITTCIKVKYPIGATCTCTNGTITLSCPNTYGSYIFVLSSLGSWTINCVQGSLNASKTITVESNQTYFIELDFNLYLYNQGDLCTTITGGWAHNADSSGYTRNGGSGAFRSGGGITWNSSDVKIDAYEVSGGDGGIAFIGTKNAIDLSLYSKLRIIVNNIAISGSEQRVVFYVANSKVYPGRTTSYANPPYLKTLYKQPPMIEEIGLDISSINTTAYIGVACFQWSGGCHTVVNISKIYLEV